MTPNTVEKISNTLNRSSIVSCSIAFGTKILKIVYRALPSGNSDALQKPYLDVTEDLIPTGITIECRGTYDGTLVFLRRSQRGGITLMFDILKPERIVGPSISFREGC